jgi:hypothetical protein
MLAPAGLRNTPVADALKNVLSVRQPPSLTNTVSVMVAMLDFLKWVRSSD